MAPIAAGDARLLILGSLPGDASLAAQRYYAHPHNQFWRLLGDAIGEPLAELDYDERLDRLAAARDRRCGMWSASAQRAGSLDGAIRQAGHNPIERLRQRSSAASGDRVQWAAPPRRSGRKLLGAASGIELIDLPSSSAANTRPFADKARAWRQLGDSCAFARRKPPEKSHERRRSRSRRRRGRTIDPGTDLTHGRRGAGRGEYRQYQRAAGDPGQAGRQGHFRPRRPEGLFGQLFQAARPCRHARE